MRVFKLCMSACAIVPLLKGNTNRLFLVYNSAEENFNRRNEGVVYYFDRASFRVTAFDQFYERSQGGPDTCLYMIVHVYTWLYPCLEKKIAP